MDSSSPLMTPTPSRKNTSYDSDSEISTSTITPRQVPRHIKSVPFIETFRHSWVITKAHHPPEALISLSLPEDNDFPEPLIITTSTSNSKTLQNQPSFTTTLKQLKLKDDQIKSKLTSSLSSTPTSETKLEYFEDASVPDFPTSPEANLAPSALHQLNSTELEPDSGPLSLPSLSSSLSSTQYHNTPLSQRTSMISSNRDSIASDLSYYSTSPIPDVKTISTRILDQPTSPLHNPLSPINNRVHHIIPNTSRDNSLDGYHTARSSLYITPSNSPRQSALVDKQLVYDPKPMIESIEQRLSELAAHSSEVELNQNPHPNDESVSNLEFARSNGNNSGELPELEQINPANIPMPPSENSSFVTAELSRSDSRLTLNMDFPRSDSPQPITPGPSDLSPEPHSVELSEEKLESLYKKRTHIANEILHTERTYVEGLELIERVFYQPLLHSLKTQPAGQALLSKKSLQDIFANLIDLLNVNRELLRQLEGRIVKRTWNPKTDCLGDIFCDMAPFFKMYSLYVKNFNSALSVISNQIQRHPPFAQFLKDPKVTSQCKGLSFEAYLILPVQRIPRYKLLIEDMLKNTPIFHKDYQGLAKALDLVKKVAVFVNETIRQHEMFMEMLRIQKSLVGFNEVYLYLLQVQISLLLILLL